MVHQSRSHFLGRGCGCHAAARGEDFLLMSSTVLIRCVAAQILLFTIQHHSSVRLARKESE